MGIAVDTGGTFTDCVASALRTLAPPRGSRRDARRGDHGKRGGLDLVCGTTVGTNALLERRGGRVTLVTTAGFEDVLEIGRQARPKLYDFFVEKPQPLVPARARIGIKERLAWDGSGLSTLATLFS